MQMEFDYSRLNGRIKDVCGSQKQFAKTIGISEHTISKKLNNYADWKQGEIMKAAPILKIRHDEISEYFFTPKVQY